MNTYTDGFLPRDTTRKGQPYYTIHKQSAQYNSHAIVANESTTKYKTRHEKRRNGATQKKQRSNFRLGRRRDNQYLCSEGQGSEKGVGLNSEKVLVGATNEPEEVSDMALACPSEFPASSATER